MRLSTFFTLAYTLEVSLFGLLFWAFTCLHFFSPILLFLNLGLVTMVTFSPLVFWIAGHQGRGRLYADDNLHNARVKLDEGLRRPGSPALEVQLAKLMESEAITVDRDKMRLAHFGLTHPARIKALLLIGVAGRTQAEADYQSRRLEHLIENTFDEWLVQTRQSRVEMETHYLDVYGQELLGLELSEVERRVRQAGFDPASLPEWNRLVDLWPDFSPLERYKQVCLLEDRLGRRLLSSNLADRMWLKFREVDRQDLLERFAQDAPETVRVAVQEARQVAQIMELFPRNPSDHLFYKERRLYVPIVLKVLGPVALTQNQGEVGVDPAGTRNPKLVAFLLATGALSKTELVAQLAQDEPVLRNWREKLGLGGTESLSVAIGQSRDYAQQNIMPKARSMVYSRTAGFSVILALLAVGIHALAPQGSVQAMAALIHLPFSQVQTWFSWQAFAQWGADKPVWQAFLSTIGNFWASFSPAVGHLTAGVSKASMTTGLGLGSSVAGLAGMTTAVKGKMPPGIKALGNYWPALLASGLWLLGFAASANGLLLIAGALLPFVAMGLWKLTAVLIVKLAPGIKKMAQSGGEPLQVWKHGLLELPAILTGGLLKNHGPRGLVGKGLLAFGIYRAIVFVAGGLGMGAHIALGPFTGILLGLLLPVLLIAGVAFYQGWLVRQLTRVTERLLGKLLPAEYQPAQGAAERTISQLMGYLALGLMFGLILIDLNLAAVPVLWQMTAGFGLLYGIIRLAATWLEKTDLERWWNARDFPEALARAYRLALQVTLQEMTRLNRTRPGAPTAERADALQAIFVKAFDLYSRGHFTPVPGPDGSGGGKRLDQATAIWRETIEPVMLETIFAGNVPARLQETLAALPPDPGFELYWQSIQSGLSGPGRWGDNGYPPDGNNGSASGGTQGSVWAPGLGLLFPKVESAASVVALPPRAAEPLAGWQLGQVLQSQGKRWRLAFENAL
jgi:hypothetical protein